MIRKTITLLIEITIITIIKTTIIRILMIIRDKKQEYY